MNQYKHQLLLIAYMRHLLFATLEQAMVLRLTDILFYNDNQ